MKRRIYIDKKMLLHLWSDQLLLVNGEKILSLKVLLDELE